LPKGPPPKPAETAPPPKPVEPLHERFRDIPTGNWNDQKPKIPGFTAPGNRYFGSRALVAQVQVTAGNWNDQKPKVPGFTAPGNKYFATRQRLAYHPAAKRFGTWINDAPASKQAPPPPPKPAETAKPKPTLPKGSTPKPAEPQAQKISSSGGQQSTKQTLEEYEKEYLARIEKEKTQQVAAAAAAAAAAATTTAAAKPTRGTLPKGF
jgi:hypothetical protein